MSRDIDEVDHTIGKTLRSLRKQRGIRLQVLAGVIGVSYQQVQKYELGRDRLSARNLYALAKFFEVEITAFFSGMAMASPVPKISSRARPNSNASRKSDQRSRKSCSPLSPH